MESSEIHIAELTSKLNANKHIESALFDLAVIGSGPSGALAAALAAKAGLSTLIIERKKHPRPKICGGFLSARSISLLPEDLNLSSISSVAVYQISIIKKRMPYSFNSKKHLGLLLERERFDQLLVEYACSKGVSLREEESLRSIEKIAGKNREDSYYLLKAKSASERQFKARYLIGADGALGNTALMAGLRHSRNVARGWGFSGVINEKSKIAETGTLKFYPLPLLGGMGWSFSGPTWTNHGVAGIAGRPLLARAYHKTFHNEPGSVPPQSWPLPFLGPLQRVADDNLALIGDAAGLVEPFSGEGLYNSFKSAILSIKAIIAAEQKNCSLADTYNPLFRENFQKVYPACLCGAGLLYARSLLAPATLPPVMAALMENKLWFNRNTG